jgi:hypothetical protein
MDLSNWLVVEVNGSLRSLAGFTELMTQSKSFISREGRVFYFYFEELEAKENFIKVFMTRLKHVKLIRNATTTECVQKSTDRDSRASQGNTGTQQNY